MQENKNETAGVDSDTVEVIVESTEDEVTADESSEATAAPESNVEQALRAELEHVNQQLTELNENHLRTAAELQNLRKRNATELEKTRKYAIDNFAKSLLDVMESLDKACEVDEGSSDVATMREGIELTRKQLLSVFERASIKKISVQAGDAFNANEHEAMTMIPTADFPTNHVVEVFRTGYTIHDRLLRAAMVIVSAGVPSVEEPTDSAPPDAGNSESN